MTFQPKKISRAQEDLKGKSSWLQIQNEHKGRKKGSGCQKSKRQKGSFSLIVLISNLKSEKKFKATDSVVFSSLLKFPACIFREP